MGLVYIPSTNGSSHIAGIPTIIPALSPKRSCKTLISPFVQVIYGSTSTLCSEDFLEEELATPLE
jgi:hypothetical protein